MSQHFLKRIPLCLIGDIFFLPTSCAFLCTSFKDDWECERLYLTTDQLFAKFVHLTFIAPQWKNYEMFAYCSAPNLCHGRPTANITKLKLDCSVCTSFFLYVKQLHDLREFHYIKRQLIMTCFLFLLTFSSFFFFYSNHPLYWLCLVCDPRDCVVSKYRMEISMFITEGVYLGQTTLHPTQKYSTVFSNLENVLKNRNMWALRLCHSVAGILHWHHL